MVTADIEDVSNLDISAREIIKELEQGRGDWEQKLPEVTAKSIIDKKLLGFKE